MPRSPSTYSLPPGTTPQQPNTVISSSMFNAFADDVAQTFNTIQPILYGGTGSTDLKLNDTDFGIKDNGDPTKIGQFNASGLPTATTRTYDLPYYSGTLGLVSDIRGQIYGLTLSNNVADATNDIDIAAGSAVDSTGAVSMLLTSALGKRLDATWVAGGTPGSTNGGRFYTTLADGWVYLFVIRNPTTGAVDAGFSDNASTPTGGASYPAGFTQFRYVGAINRTSGAIRAFIQNGDEFLYTNVATDVLTATLSTSGSLFTLSAPPSSLAKSRVTIGNAAAAALVLLNTPGTTSTVNTPSGNVSIINPGAGLFSAAHVETRLNSSSQAFAISSVNNTTLIISVYGWEDNRGRF